MKVVITTQICENYGEADAPHWKFKGGNFYVVSNLTKAQVAKVEINGIPTLKALIESKNPMFEEYVVNCQVVEDDAVACEPWETPTMCSWEQGRWVARQEYINDQYGYMRREVAKKADTYEMAMGGERTNFRSMITLRDGREMPYAEANKLFQQEA